MRRATVLFLSAALACAPLHQPLGGDPRILRADFAGRPLGGGSGQAASADSVPGLGPAPFDGDEVILYVFGVVVLLAAILIYANSCSCPGKVPCTACSSPPPR